MPGDPRSETQIVSSNGWALAAFVSANGGLPTNMGIAPDNAGALKSMAGAAAGADLIVTTGGASVGKHDLIRSALGDIGLELDFWRIAMRPGKPLLYGTLGDTPVLGLPGNPVSSMVCALIFLAPLLDAFLGRKRGDPTLSAALGADLGENDQRQDYLRAALAVSGDGALVRDAFRAPGQLHALPSRPCPVPHRAAAARPGAAGRRPGFRSAA